LGVIHCGKSREGQIYSLPRVRGDLLQEIADLEPRLAVALVAQAYGSVAQFLYGVTF